MASSAEISSAATADDEVERPHIIPARRPAPCMSFADPRIVVVRCAPPTAGRPGGPTLRPHKPAP